MDKKDFDWLCQMNFRELKYELLHKKNSPERELEIRKLMKDRAIKCKLRQRYLDALPNTDEVFLDDSDFDQSYQLDELKDPRYCKDSVNNNLMARMDSEMLIRQSNKRKRTQKDFIRPYA